MRTGYTGHITPVEWRWVIVVSSMLVLIALLPFLWVVLSGASQNQQFMGALHQYPGTASHLGRIIQGTRGEWLGRYLLTPEPHNGVLIDGIYILLGQVSRLTSIPAIVIFHVARVGAAIFMYVAIYYLAAMIWMRVRTRRIFFLLAVVGSGFGWLLSPLTQSPLFPDVASPSPFPFYATLINVHLPLATGCLAILVSAMIEALRPGMTTNPGVDNAGVILFTFSLLLAFLYTQALLPVVIACVGILLARVLRRRDLMAVPLRWMLWLIVPALPLVAYYVTVFLYNPVVSQVWLQENLSPAPPVWMLLAGLGLPLIIAVPGIYRAIRRFEPDGNQFMLLWLLSMLLLVYLTPLIQMNFALGLMLPIAYFGARAMEDFWFNLIPRTWRYRLIVALLPIISISHFYVLFIPLVPIADESPNTSSGVLLERDYSAAVQWLRNRRPDRNQVALASPQVSLWLPAWTGIRVVYGHSSETLDAGVKRQAVENWYRTTDPAECERVLNGAYTAADRYRVTYVFYGPYESQLGSGACLDDLLQIATFGSVKVYFYAG